MNGHSARFLLFITAMLLTNLQSYAMPRSGEGKGANYLTAAEDLSSWHAGAYVRYHDRTVKYDKVRSEVRLVHALAYAAYDIFPWMSIYGLAGQTDCQEKRFNRSDDAFEFGVGAWFNLLDHDTFEHLTTIQRFRINSTFQYSMFKNDHVTWGELLGNVTFGITHEVIGSKFFWPESFTLYAGPSLNVLISDDYDQSSSGVLGLVLGLDMQVNRMTAIGASLELYDKDEAGIGYVTVRF